MTRTLATALGNSDRANISVFLIAFVVMASVLWLADHGGATSTADNGIAFEVIDSVTTDN